MPLRWPRLTAIAQFACRARVNGMPYLVHVLYLHVIRAWLPATWSAHLLTVFRARRISDWVGVSAELITDWVGVSAELALLVARPSV